MDTNELRKMSGIIGKKVGMTSIFDAEGKNIPCTVIEAGPCVVTQLRTVDADGYTAVQLAFDEKKEKNRKHTWCPPGLPAWVFWV